jgi:hypothetical protein
VSFAGVAGLAGIGFVLVAVAINLVYLPAGLPMPAARKTHQELTDSFAAVGDALERPSLIARESRMLTAAACTRERRFSFHRVVG